MLVDSSTDIRCTSEMQKVFKTVFSYLTLGE